MKAKILIPQPVAEDGTDYLSEQGYELIYPGASRREDILRSLAGCEAILLRGTLVDKEILEAGKLLKIVACQGTGFDKADLEAAARRGIWVSGAPLSAACSVAEYAMTLILMLAKEIPFYTAAVREGNFSPQNQRAGRELENKTLGIIGLGRVGLSLAKKAAKGFNMDVFAYDPLCPPDRPPPEVSLLEDIETVLKEADFVSLHAPNIPEVKKLFDAPRFELMKTGAYFINCSRPDLVDEGALLRALEGGKIAGAALDVYDPQIPPGDNPLLRLPNVIATPRIASRTLEADIKAALHAAMEIHRVLSGERPRWPLNLPVFKGGQE
ncbi:MAG: hydroxyacid dehydrogenase [Treponema sp.]|jgi:D-3-phosphoglycerate dehydrogenase|nr:hydroxyacid dehydrogenase [Treponema sp.]